MAEHYYPPGNAWRELTPGAFRALTALVETPSVHVVWGIESPAFDRMRSIPTDRPWGSSGAAGGEDFAARWANIRAQLDSWDHVWSALSVLSNARVIARSHPRKIRPNSYGLRVVRLKQYRSEDFAPRPNAVFVPLLDGTMHAVDYLLQLPEDYPRGLPR